MEDIKELVLDDEFELPDEPGEFAQDDIIKIMKEAIIPKRTLFIYTPIKYFDL